MYVYIKCKTNDICLNIGGCCLLHYTLRTDEGMCHCIIKVSSCRNTYRHDLQHSTRRQHTHSKAASPATVPNKNMSHLGTAKTIKYIL